MHKKGVSPLIATILLIAFAMALGSVVMNWGLNLQEAQAGPCGKAKIDLKPINNADVCLKTGEQTSLTMIVANEGKAAIKGISVWVLGDQNTEIINIDNINIAKGNLLEISGSRTVYNQATLGNLQSIQLIPKIDNKGQTEVCTTEALKTTNFKAC